MAETGQAFSISPPLVELSADPGQKVTANIKLTNVSAGPLHITVQANDFGSKNETGEPNILFDENKETTYSLRRWVVTPQEFDLKSQETRTIAVPIQVPANAEPGGHYGVIRFTGTSEGGSNDVSLAASIGSLVLLQVSGDIRQEAAVEDFYTAGVNFDKQSFFESTPLQFVTRIRNDGNIHVKPTGTVTVTDSFGNDISSLRINGDPNDEKQQPRSILPQSVRRFDTALQDKQLFGRYEATLDLTYADGKTLQQTTHFWVIPYRLILAGIAIAALVVFGLRWGIKRYNTYIVKKADASKKQKKE
jgi:hypothetical protein